MSFDWRYARKAVLSEIARLARSAKKTLDRDPELNQDEVAEEFVIESVKMTRSVLIEMFGLEPPDAVRRRLPESYPIFSWSRNPARFRRGMEFLVDIWEAGVKLHLPELLNSLPRIGIDPPDVAQAKRETVAGRIDALKLLWWKKVGKVFWAKEDEVFWPKKVVNFVAILVASSAGPAAELGAGTEPAIMPTVETPRKGRPKNTKVQNRREIIARISATGKEGESYIQALNARGLSTPIEWQKDENCPKSYLDAYNHADPKEREKWRARIWDEKYKAVKALAKHSTRQKS